MLVKSNRAETLVVGIDGKLIHQLNARMSLVGSLGVGYDTLSDRDSVTTAFAGSPDVAFITTDGIDPKPWVGRAGLGAAYKIMNSLAINARYDVDFCERFFNQAASANIHWMF